MFIGHRLNVVNIRWLVIKEVTFQFVSCGQLHFNYLYIFGGSSTDKYMHDTTGEMWGLYWTKHRMCDKTGRDVSICIEFTTQALDVFIALFKDKHTAMFVNKLFR